MRERVLLVDLHDARERLDALVAQPIPPEVDARERRMLTQGIGQATATCWSYLVPLEAEAGERAVGLERAGERLDVVDLIVLEAEGCEGAVAREARGDDACPTAREGVATKIQARAAAVAAQAQAKSEAAAAKAQAEAEAIVAAAAKKNKAEAKASAAKIEAEAKAAAATTQTDQEAAAAAAEKAQVQQNLEAKIAAKTAEIEQTRAQMDLLQRYQKLERE